jgi:hypothetical protein
MPAVLREGAPVKEFESDFFLVNQTTTELKNNTILIRNTETIIYQMDPSIIKHPTVSGEGINTTKGTT